jgi:hypothetical protein
MIVCSAHGMVASTGATGGEQPSTGPEAYPHLDAPGPGRVPLIRVGSQTSAADQVGLDLPIVKKYPLDYPAGRPVHRIGASPAAYTDY